MVCVRIRVKGVRNMPIPWDWLLSWWSAVSLSAVVITIADKRRARRGGRRVPERTLLLVAALGGAAAMLAVMKAIRHKTLHKKFMIGLPVIITAHVALLVWFILR